MKRFVTGGLLAVVGVWSSGVRGLADPESGGPPAAVPEDPILWDNYPLEYFTGKVNSHHAPAELCDSQAADDFLLDAACEFPWLITGLEWVGRFSGGAPLLGQPFNIIFYPDDGTGEAPCLPEAHPPDPGCALALHMEIQPLFEQSLGGGYYHYSAELPEPFTAEKDVKYWVVIQWVGPCPPQWGIARHEWTELAPAVRGQAYYGHMYWTTAAPLANLAFRLRGYRDWSPEFEACCLPDGGCAEIHPSCCDDYGGEAQGPESTCPAETVAFCLPDGTCQDLTELCGSFSGGTSQGAGTACTAGEACCLPSGACQQDIDPLCCASSGGFPQGAGTECSAETSSCCVPDGTCGGYDPLCCDEAGGWPPYLEECLGDLSGNGIDDACDEPPSTWHTVDGGPGEPGLSTGGGFEVRGSIGEPDTAVLAGGSFEVWGGFRSPRKLGDIDADGDVDLDDFRRFSDCLTGTGGGLPDPDCLFFDFQSDLDVDLEDFAEFQEVFTG